jgi:hypothetical protein
MLLPKARIEIRQFMLEKLRYRRANGTRPAVSHAQQKNTAGSFFNGVRKTYTRLLANLLQRPLSPRPECLHVPGA